VSWQPPSDPPPPDQPSPPGSDGDPSWGGAPPPPPPPPPGWAQAPGGYGGYPQGPPGYQQQQYPGYGPVQQNNGLATASMVLGILGCLPLASIVAIVLGFVARSQIRRSNGTQKGEGMATAGIVLGFVWVVIGILLVASGDFTFEANT
jgi:hypothetical protein